MKQVEEKDYKKEQAKLKNMETKHGTNKQEFLFSRAPENISPEEALAMFRRLKEEGRARRQLQELKEISQWGKTMLQEQKKLNYFSSYVPKTNGFEHVLYLCPKYTLTYFRTGYIF